MVKPVWNLPVDVFVRRVLAEIEDARAAGAIDAVSIADALNARGFRIRNGRQLTAATSYKLLCSSRTTDIIPAIKIR